MPNQSAENKFGKNYKTFIKVFFIVLSLVSLSGFISAPIALGIGLLYAILFKNPFVDVTQKLSKELLKWSVVGLGFGMNIFAVVEAGKSGFIFTTSTILGTLLIGFLLGKLFRSESKTSTLISSGTAICGGSAIAAIGPAIDADAKSMSVSLVTIFILNALALFVFPVIGHWLNLSQAQFGLWSAIAIHDTSSVVGAASKYGEEALQIATTVKLSRAIWIIPISLTFVLINRKKGKNKIKIPWFIFLFILATFITTYFPAGESIYRGIKTIAKHGLVLTLFLIGSGLSLSDIKMVGYKPILQGIILWILVSTISVMVILNSV